MTDVPLSATISAEAREILSVLRCNRRFGYILPFGSAATPNNEHPLVKELKAMRDLIRVPVATNGQVNTASNNKISSPLLIPAEALLNALQPIFEVIRSRDASSIITGAALQSLNRIAMRLIHLAVRADILNSYAHLLSVIVDAVAVCRFDATDPASDEVVLGRIIRVVVTICSSDAIHLLSDATILRGIEACLGYASGKRRASDLLKRTADFALVDIFQSLAIHLNTIASSSVSSVQPCREFPTPNPNSSNRTAQAKLDNTYPFLSIFIAPVEGSGSNYNIDSDTFSQHGPASLEVIVVIVQLASRMADPSYSQSLSERVLGLQLLSTFITTAGPSLRKYTTVKKVLVRDCARAILRSLGLFRSQPTIISLAFTVSIQLVHVLEEDAAPFLLALLEQVFPFYISGLENVLPLSGPIPTIFSRNSSASTVTENTARNGPKKNNIVEGPEIENVKIDPVIREIGLEALSDLLSIPGLLCVVYQMSDCTMNRPDVVQPLLRALGHAAKLDGLRRRSKRLHALNSGADIGTDPADGDTEEEDGAMFSGSKSNVEASRLERSAALICADTILTIVETISDRLKLETAGIVKPLISNEKAFERSRKVRGDKERLQRAAAAFNASEKVGKVSKLLVLLQEHGLAVNKVTSEGTVEEDLKDDIESIVRFLRETPGLMKDKIGNLLGEPDNLSRKVLAKYTDTFDFEGWPFTESLRVYLESFRLPGEAQKIDRIVQSFASAYYLQNTDKDERNAASATDKTTNDSSGDTTNSAKIEPTKKPERDNSNMSVLKSADAAYVLSFSVVMLNTDQHNDSIRKRMSFEDFMKNCRGINDGDDLPKWFLSDVFESIAAVEIRMSDEAGVGALTDLFWDEQLRKADAMESEFFVTSESRVFDKQVFTLTWEAGIIAANTILKEAVDPNSVQKALEGFLSVSRCSTMFKMTRPIDFVILSLCDATTILDGPLYGAVVRFGTDIKAQMAAVALSGVCRECGDWLRGDGWQTLVAYFLRLHALCLLPDELEKKIGGYGSELLGANKKEIKSSGLIPAWWPSCTDSAGLPTETAKPKKSSRANGFFAAFLAASIGTETSSDDEDEEDDRGNNFGDNNTNEIDPKSYRHRSRSLPHFLRTHVREDKEAQDLARKCIARCRIEDVVVTEAKVLQWKSLKHLCESVSQIAFQLLDSKTENASKQNDQEEKGPDDEPVKDNGNSIETDETSLNQSGSNTMIGIGSILHGAGVVEKDSKYKSFINSSTELTEATRGRDEQKASEFIIAFCVDVLCELTLQNRDRLNIPWPEFHNLLVRIIAPATESLAVLERAVVALLRIGVRLLHRNELRDDVLRGFNLLVRLPPMMMNALSVPLACGVLNVVKGHGTIIQSTSGWHAILSIVESLARHQIEGRRIGLECIKCILLELHGSIAVSTQTYAPLLDAILAYTSSGSIDTSIEAMELLYTLSQCVASFIKKSTDEEEAWAEYWGPLFLGFAAAIGDSRGKVRNCAIATLERVIASRGSIEMLTAAQWDRMLTNVFLPVMTQLFSTKGYYHATLKAERDAQRVIFAERSKSGSDVGDGGAGGGAGAGADYGMMGGKNESFDSSRSIMNGGGSGRFKNRTFTASPEHESQLVKSVSAACSLTRMRAVMLTSKTFLLHHVEIAAGLEDERFTKLWLNVLEIFRVAVQPKNSDSSGQKDTTSGKGRSSTDGVNNSNKNEQRKVSSENIVTADDDDVTEHVPECVKNMLLVMCDSGLLTKSMPARWGETFALVHRFIPGIEDTVCAAIDLRSPVKQAADKGKMEDGDGDGDGTVAEVNNTTMSATDAAAEPVDQVNGSTNGTTATAGKGSDAIAVLPL